MKKNSDAKILLVEDDPLLQHVFNQQLVKLGFTVHTTVGNGQEAVDNVLNEGFHLVFMDVRLPVMDGLSATQRIRTAEKAAGKYTPIVGLTAFAHRGKCLRVGMDDFLQKPIVLEELVEVMNKWTDPITLAKYAKQARKDAPLLEPEDFDPISKRLNSIKDKISKLRNTLDLDKKDSN